MSQATITTQIHQSLDVELNFASQITFNLHRLVDDCPDFADIAVREAVGPRVRINATLVQNFLGDGAANAVDIGQGDNNPLIARKVYTGNTSHDPRSSPVSLDAVYGGDFHR